MELQDLFSMKLVRVKKETSLPWEPTIPANRTGKNFNQIYSFNESKPMPP